MSTAAWLAIGFLIGVHAAAVILFFQESRAWRQLLTAYLQQRVKKSLDLAQRPPSILSGVIGGEEAAGSPSILSLPKDLQAEIDLQEELERQEQLRELRDG